MEGGLDMGDSSPITERHSGRLNASKNIEFATIGGIGWDVDGRVGSSGGPIDCPIDYSFLSSSDPLP